MFASTDRQILAKNTSPRVILGHTAFGLRERTTNWGGAPRTDRFEHSAVQKSMKDWGGRAKKWPDADRRGGLDQIGKSIKEKDGENPLKASCLFHFLSS